MCCSFVAGLLLVPLISFAERGGDRYERRPSAEDVEISVQLGNDGQKGVLAAEGEVKGAVPPDVGGAGAVSLTLDDCIRLALTRNQKLKASGYEIEAARGQLREASALFWPVFEYTYRAAPVPTNVDDAFNAFFDGQVTMFHSIHVGIGVPLITFGQLSTAKHMARNGVEAARINEIKAHEGTIYQVKQLYYGVQLARELINLLGDSVEKLGSKIAEEEGRTDSDMDPFDIMKLKVTKVDLERRLAEAEQNHELALEGLRIQLDLEPGTPIELDNSHLRPVLAKLGAEQDYIDAALRFQPESRLVDVGVDTKQSQYKLEKFKLYPKVGFGFYVEAARAMDPITGLNLTDDFNNPFNYTRAGLGIQLKGEFDFHGSAGRIKKARAEYYKASYERMIAKRGLALEIRKSYLTAKRAQEDVGRARKAESIARQMTFISKVNTDMGIGDKERYGDALMLLLLQRGSYFKAIFDYNMALADLAQRVTLAKYDELTRTPDDLEEYELFDEPADEADGGFETYGIESEVPPVGGAPSHEPVLREFVSDELVKDAQAMEKKSPEPRLEASAPERQDKGPQDDDKGANDAETLE